MHTHKNFIGGLLQGRPSWQDEDEWERRIGVLIHFKNVEDVRAILSHILPHILLAVPLVLVGHLK